MRNLTKEVRVKIRRQQGDLFMRRKDWEIVWTKVRDLHAVIRLHHILDCLIGEIKWNL